LRQPLLLPAVALAAGIAISRLVSFSIREVSVLICAFGALAVVASFARGRVAGYLAGSQAVLLCGTLLELRHRQGPPPELDADAREVVVVTGCVVEPPAFSDSRQRFVLELAPGARARVNLYADEGDPPQALYYGQRVEIEGTVRRPHNFGNPGSFDYEGYLARQHIYWTISARPKGRVRVLSGQCGSRLQSALFTLRTACLHRLGRLYHDKPYEAAMMEAILIGNKDKLKRIWTEDFRSTGTYHVIVISGLHVAVLCGVVLLLLRLFLAGPGTTGLVAGLLSWLYALMVGWQAPVVRAAAGVSLYLLARYFYRRQCALNVLAAAAIVFLVFDPHQLFDPSFQLSFLCVASIAALAAPVLEATSGPLLRGLAGLEDTNRDIHLPPQVAQFRVELRLLAQTVCLWTRFGRRWVLVAAAMGLRVVLRAYEMFVISAAVQVGVALPMALYFHRISISGLSANIIVVPLTSWLVVAGFAAITTGWRPIAAFTGWLLGAVRQVVQWHANHEPIWRIPDPPLWLAVCFSLAVIMLAVTIKSRPRWRWISFTLTAMFLTAIVWHPFPPKVRPGWLELTAIDVGQGDSLFVGLPKGKLMLVDGGGIAGFRGRVKTELDIGEDVVSPYLWSRSIRRLDVVVASHAHEDHIGGLRAVLNNFRPKELWTASTPRTKEWAELYQAARGAGVLVRRLRRGQSLCYGGTQIDVLAPFELHAEPEEVHDEDSLMIRIRFQKRSILLTGDQRRQVETELAERGQLIPTEILKVAHHGSKTSTGELFLDRVKPLFAVISAGRDNPYGHPHPTVLARLLAHRSTVFRTDLWGRISIWTDGGRQFELETERWTGGSHRLFNVF